ncbi:hypothetical protein FisN_1Lh614 [Fistulifera solaris]|uniref:SPX domain-containing protein n=1 Tax=Fistulifera solaris TaxID=1519565 RepID=A0A1Z5K0Y9_FISSO|nr:hypothetical protein FisN_1Lh614 [Fistulifera solaris]|eukprot:GAX19917.1 hypothetical protein FisN_1Lh614 [Fistulifera solaris]
MLKKLIKDLPLFIPSDDSLEKPEVEEKIMSLSDTLKVCSQDNCVAHGESEQPQCDPRTSDDDFTGDLESDVQHQKQELGRNPGEIAFFKQLHVEFKKASHFFDKAQQEFSIREERVREGMEIMKRSDALASEKWALSAKSIYRLYKDLLLLETFAIMTYCSFSKILKKHDKVTGHQTRTAFMSKIVNKSNFASYPKVLDMINRCEQMYEDVSKSLLEQGNEALYEDERLFINMISRLNEQTLGQEDAPEKNLARRRSSIAPIDDSQTHTGPLSSLRSLVDASEVRRPPIVVDDRKRSGASAPISKGAKRGRQS